MTAVCTIKGCGQIVDGPNYPETDPQRAEKEWALFALKFGDHMQKHHKKELRENMYIGRVIGTEWAGMRNLQYAQTSDPAFTAQLERGMANLRALVEAAKTTAPVSLAMKKRDEVTA